MTTLDILSHIKPPKSLSYSLVGSTSHVVERVGHGRVAVRAGEIDGDL